MITWTEDAVIPDPKLPCDFSGLHAGAIYRALIAIIIGVLALFAIGLFCQHQIAIVINLLCAGICLTTAGAFVPVCCSVMSNPKPRTCAFCGEESGGECDECETPTCIECLTRNNTSAGEAWFCPKYMDENQL